MEEVNRLLDSDEDLQALFKVVGFVVIQFGQAEQSLDLIVASIFQNVEDDSRPRKIPKMLEPKLKYLNKSVEELAELGRHKEQMRSLISAFRRMSELRNNVIHGAISDFSAKEGAFTFVKLDIHDGFHHVREFDFNLTKFPGLADELIELGKQANSLALKVHESYCT